MTTTTGNAPGNSNEPAANIPLPEQLLAEINELLRMEEGRGLSQAGNEPLRGRVREEAERVEEKLPDGVKEDDIRIVMSHSC